MGFYFISIEIPDGDHCLKVRTVPLIVKAFQFFVFTIIDNVDISDHIPFSIF